MRQYTTGQRDAEQASTALGEAGADLERATQSFEPVVRRHEQVMAERQRLAQEQKELEKVRVYRGPTLG